MTKCWICRNEFIRDKNDTSKDAFACESCWVNYEDDYESLLWEENNAYDERLINDN